MTHPLGRGVAFPFIAGADGRIAWSQGERNIRESIAIILQTDRGERVALTKFGAGLPTLLFEPNNAATHASLAKYIKDALDRWEPRINVQDVEVTAHPSDRETALARVTYTLVATGEVERISLDVPVAATAEGGV